MKGRPRLKSQLPPSLLGMMPSYQNIGDPKPSTSANSLMEVDISDTDPKSLVCIKVHKGVQAKPKTFDRTTYCTFSKSKNFPVLEEDIEMAEEVLPSTQGSTTSADISEILSETIVKTVNPGNCIFMLNIIANKPQSYLGLPKKYYWLIQYLEINLKIKSLHLIITLYKIKYNIPFSQISDMFEVLLITLWRIFPKTLCTLSKYFKQIIFPPSVYNVKSNLPPCLRTSRKYSKVYCIIDCFEISIEKPSNPITQALTWSQHKINIISPKFFSCNEY
ncbi:hypothetical protein O3G_MSEX005556 [Manduca sexta]|uniref:Uncharacterized protein n=1 Tax=Manduca sexta TaxID=7130 RepID=A0A921YZG9_MANSE|nr:hypothetical protein O3G_MSEX005556 [Manduca sexta]